MNSENVIKDQVNKKQKDNFIKQQQQLKAMKATTTSKVLSAESMIEDLLSKKETFQKKKDPSSSNSFPNIQNEPSWLNSDNRSSVHPLYEQIWSMVKLQSVSTVQQQPELADTTIVSTLLMTSGLTTDMLGFIWSLANNTVPGALTQQELYCVLALVALAQSGYAFNSVAVLNQLPQPPIPNLDLSVAVQLKTTFGAVPPVNIQSAMSVQPLVSGSSVNNIGVSATTEPFLNNVIGVNYFSSQMPANVVPKTTSVNDIMSLDVNNLQSARSLTIPNSLRLDFNSTTGAPSSLPSVSQNLNLSRSTTHCLTQENVSGIGPIQNFGILMPPQNPSTVPNQVLPSPSGINNAIPSISLGISSPSSLVSLNQKTDVAFVQPNLSCGNSVASPMNDKNDGLSFNNTIVNKSKNIISKLSTDLDLSNFKKEIDSKIDDSDNIDEIFDSLSTERAMSSSSNSVPAEQYKPNYNINLLDTFSDIKPIFPDVQCSDPITISNENQVLSNSGTIVTHNPVYQNDDADDNFSYKNSKQKTDSSSDNIDDDFNDFQSADFNTFNNINCDNLSISHDSTLCKSNESPDKNDDFYDNFTDFQQATSSSISGSLKISCEFISGDEKSSKDENLFSNPSKEPFDGFSANDFNDRLQIVSKDLSSNFKDAMHLNNDEGILSSSTSFNNSRLHCSSKTVIEQCKSEMADGDSLFNSVQLENNQPGEDRYSALRMLEVNDPSSSSKSDDDCNNKSEGNFNDDFGDFIGVDPCSEPGQLQLSDISTASPVNSIDDTSIQVKCLEACLDVLQKSYDILTSASTPEVLNQVLNDPRGSAHLTCLLEVYKVSERLMQHIDSSALVMQVHTIWNSIVPYIDGTKHKQMEETVGPFCSLCKCNYGPSPVRYGLNTYHAPCANLYLHYVNPVLPTVAN